MIPGVVWSAFKASVDDVGDDAVARKPIGRLVGIGGSPCADDDVVARRLVVLWSHPKPYGRLEGYDHVCGHQVRVAEQLRSKSNGFSCWPVVVVADN